MRLYTVEVDSTKLPQADIDTIETFLFDIYGEAIKFRDHLRDLYELDVHVEEVCPTTYDEAIQDFVEMFGPSPENDLFTDIHKFYDAVDNRGKSG